LRAFLSDKSPDAYEKVVDRFARPARARRTLGSALDGRLAHSDPFGNGEEYRYSQPHIWRWRDWIVESLNEGKGYDRMVLEMLAADELAPDDPKALRATGSGAGSSSTATPG
jgi:hypothetical protein